jgi:hypothetical protein
MIALLYIHPGTFALSHPNPQRDMLTRWYGAHEFAMGTQCPPYDKIGRTYANAFDDTLGATPRREHITIVPKKKNATTELNGSFPKIKVMARGS